MDLQKLLEHGVQYAPHYLPAFNSDHLPMTLCAMSGLGASDQQLMEFREDYATRLHPLEVGERVNHWRDGIGQAAAYGALLNNFSERLNQISVAEQLSEVLPVFLPGIAMGAFHPIIRLGYAVDFDSHHEIAAALAYMTITHTYVPVDSGRPVDLSSLLLKQAKSPKVELQSGRFGASIIELVESGRYPQGCAKDLETIAQLTLQLFQATRNFFALHLVTGCQALRCVLDDQTMELGVASMTGAVLASHQVLGSPDLDPVVMAPSESLDQEHAYKYAWACLSEFRRYGDPEYLAEIERFRAVGLVPEWVMVQ